MKKNNRKNKPKTVREIRRLIIQQEQKEDKSFQRIVEELSDTISHYLKESKISSRRQKFKLINLVIKRLQERYFKMNKLKNKKKELMTNFYERLSYAIKTRLKLINY